MSLLSPEDLPNVRFIDHAPEPADLMADARAGLSERPLELSSKFFYDAVGSELFDAITRLPEYYLTRTEAVIFDARMPEIRAALGPNIQLIEFGAGLGGKTRKLVAALDAPSSVVLIEISTDALRLGATQLAAVHSELEIIAVCADYSQPVELPEPTVAPTRRAVFFPGSTIGNFELASARDFLAGAAALVGAGGQLLIGYDLVKDVDVVEAAYNDAAGVTAEFNINLLRRLQAAGAELDVSAFSHHAPFVTEHSRIEMHLVAKRDTRIQVGDLAVDVSAGERITTEHSHKYTLDGFRALAGAAGWAHQQTWTDAGEQFALSLFAVAE